MVIGTPPEWIQIHLTNYSLGANYCRKTFFKGSVSIFVYRNLKYKTINIHEYNIDKDIEDCAIQLDSIFNPLNAELNLICHLLTLLGSHHILHLSRIRVNKLCILVIYRSLRGDFTNFLKWLDLILQKLYNKKYKIIIYGDVNVNYLTDNNRRSQLDAVLHSYNLTGIVEFPTRYGLISQTAIENVFIDNVFIATFTIRKQELYPLINGLSDCDVQLLILNKVQKWKRNVILTSKEKSISIQ